MLNIAGSEYDYGQVVFAVLEECEHRRRSFDSARFEAEATECARAKVAKIREAYEEIGGSSSYWESLEKEVMTVVVPQYVPAAHELTERERHNFYIWRGGDVAARFAFALAGLVLGGIIIWLPFIPIVEDTFAFFLTLCGFVYPDLMRFMYERRHARLMNQLITTSEQYQHTAGLYMTAKDVTKSLTPGNQA